VDNLFHQEIDIGVFN